MKASLAAQIPRDAPAQLAPCEACVGEVRDHLGARRDEDALDDV